MTADLWTRLADLVPHALELPPAERRAFLDTACRDATGTLDGDLHREAEALLAASDAADAHDRLVSPLHGFARGVADDEVLAAATVPQRIGAWTLGGLLGEGGMGVVYRATRSDGAFEREVALKRLRAGHGPDLARRLDAERRTLARLEHDGIARLYDGGVDAEGTPFLVMERVDGEPITAYANRAGLDVRARVALVRRVCAAVAYAHRHLVVHRDLKPSNVFVTPAGDPKLLDFGVAKLLDADDGGTATLTTLPGALTPAYAAPEQVRSEPVTTATDVYALGVLLYELLAGQRPYDLSGLTAAETERTVCETVPPPPSAVASADRRRALRGDLDTVVMTALDKTPARRYATAEALADDLGRVLAGEPVVARPASRAYRARLFVRRHRGAVAAAAALAIALVGGTVATAWQARAARAEAVRAEAARGQAEGALAFLEQTILLGDPQQAESDPPLSAVLDSASARVDREAAAGVAPLVHSALASVYLGRGDPARAAGHARQAAGGLRAEGGVRYATAQAHWGQALADGGDTDRALVHYREALAALDAAGAPDAARASVLNGTAAVLFAASRYDAAEPLYREALVAARRAGATTTEVTALQNLAALTTETGRPNAALPMLRRIIAVSEASADPALTYGLPFARVNLANALSTADQPAEALAAYRTAAAAFDARLGSDHPEAIAAHVSLANHLTKMGRTADATRVATQALETARTVLPADHPYRAYAENVAGTALCADADPARGAALLETSQTTRRAAMPADHWLLANGESVLGACLARLGRTDEAGRRLRASAAALGEALGPDDPKAQAAAERLATFEAGRP